MAASNNNINIFQKLEKFSGKIGDDLSSWLRSFDRCCLIVGKIFWTEIMNKEVSTSYRTEMMVLPRTMQF